MAYARLVKVAHGGEGAASTGEARAAVERSLSLFEQVVVYTMPCYAVPACQVERRSLSFSGRLRRAVIGAVLARGLVCDAMRCDAMRCDAM